MERELWKTLYWLAKRLDKPWGRWLYADSDVLAVYWWAVVHDRPVRWAAEVESWPEDLRPALWPSPETVSRRLRRPTVVELMLAVEEHLLALLLLGQYWVRSLDGKPLAVSPVSKDPDAGCGRCAGSWLKGYKLHAVWGAGPMPLAWALAPMNTSEKTIARQLLAELPGEGYVLADTQYDVGALYDLAAKQGYQLVVKKTKDRGRGGLGHRPQSVHRRRSIELLQKPFGRALYRRRKTVECCFGTLACTGGGLLSLPAWVRRFPRVRNWVHSKLLLNGVRWLLRHAPEKLALA